MKSIVSCALCCWFTLTSYSQATNFDFPFIPPSGKSINDFVPTGWILKNSLSGDFNQDKRIDFVLVIERKDSLSVEDTTCFSDQPFYPKILITVFMTAGNEYKTSAVATNIFGICNWGIQGTDPFNKLLKRDNTFAMEFSDGGTLRNIYTYYFRYQNSDWYLIGASELSYWAGHEGAYFEDLNLISGIKLSIDKTGPSGKDISSKKSFFEPQPLIKLTNFTPKTKLPFTPENR